MDKRCTNYGSSWCQDFECDDCPAIGFDDPKEPEMDELKAPDDVREVVLEIRQDLLNSELAPAPFTEPWYVDASAMRIVSYCAPLLAAAEQKGRQEERERIQGKWLDKPDKGGWWWKAVFMDEMCCGVHPTRVIDYDRPGRGLEVDEGHGSTIPVDKYKINYYPNSMWLYIPEPEYPSWHSLGDA